MKRLFLLFILACPVWATTYYISTTVVGASDSNNGTTKTTPWLHAPGMTGCSANCASKVPQPGDMFILRGGDTWHWSAGSGTVGLPWTWNPSPFTWNGTGANPITVGGEDINWFSGTFFTRPKLNGDNPLSTSAPASCAVNNSSDFLLQQGSHVIFDNIEFLGYCHVDTTSTEMITMQARSCHSTFSNFYVHGWTSTGTHGQRARIFNGSTGGSPTCQVDPEVYPQTKNEWAFNIVDGTDSSTQSGTVLFGDCYNFHHNYVTHVNNMVCNDMHLLHDNVFDFFNEDLSTDNTDHGNIWEAIGESNEVNYIYNNVVRHIGTLATIGVGFSQDVTTGFGDYNFNNVFYDLSVAGNNYWIEQSAAAPRTFLNNTLQYATNASMVESASSAENNHFIAANTSNVFLNAPSSEITDLKLTNAQGTTAGYTAASQYAPASGTCNGNPSLCTIGVGTNATSTICNTLADSAAAAACKQTTTRGCSYNLAGPSQDATLTCPALTPIARSPSAAWDIGAYQFSGAGSPAVGLAPNNLAFGNQQVGTSTTSQQITLTNIGSADLVITSITPSVTDYSQTNTCPLNPSVLAQGLSCAINVTFTPRAEGSRPGGIIIADNASDTPQTASLTGTGIILTPTAAPLTTISCTQAQLSNLGFSASGCTFK